MWTSWTRELLSTAVLVALALPGCSRARSGAETAPPARRAAQKRDAGDAVPSRRGAAARGCTEPDAEPVVALPDGSAADFAACAVEVRAAVRALASANYPGDRPAVTTTLKELGDCVAQAPDKPEEIARLVATVRAQTRRIQKARSIEPELAGWIKSALVAVVDALGALPVGRGDYDATWVTPARRAAAAIDARDGLVFQRAPIQDAFRAAADAMVVAAGATPSHARPARRHTD